MKCQKHLTDLSADVGVCASCVRERLLDVIGAQVQAQRQAQFPQGLQDCRKSDALPRSVSPYISHRKSDSAATWQFHGQPQQFHRTPHVGPSGSLMVESGKDKKSGAGKFSSIFMGIFRSKLDPPRLDPVDSCSASRSSFFSIIPGRRKKQSRTFSVDEDGNEARRNPGRVLGRGMSPAQLSEGEDHECFQGGLSGYTSESSQNWKQTPRTPASRRSKGRTAEHSRNVSGLAFCLSPMVRPGPNRNWSQKAPPPELLASTEGRASSKPQLSTGASFGKNRSRKLADFGKQNYNLYPNH